MHWGTLFDYICKGLDTSAPLAFAALGGVFSEKSGVVNIALEGGMLFSAFSIVWGSIIFHSLWLGLLFAVVIGMAFAAIHAVVTITYKVNQIISGVALNILAEGIARFLSQNIFGQETQSAMNPYSFPSYRGMNVFSLVVIPVAILSWFVLNKTVFGLRLRSVGENPEAADTLGINVTLMRYSGVLISGAMCGLSAAVLYPSRWVSGMTGGRGFIALAAMIFGRWSPIGAVLASLLFGYADAARISFASSIQIPSQFVQMFPYVLAVVVLAGVVGRSRAPAADGIPYEKGED
ncbi:MAG TPA: ABC transporter permease [Rectinemataceae bacterium]|nr:ABC transporter permease [Rectinemataceae bacterium]